MVVVKWSVTVAVVDFLTVQVTGLVNINIDVILEVTVGAGIDK